MKTKILTRPQALIAAFAIVAVLVLAACGGSSSSSSSSATTPASSPTGGSTSTTSNIVIQNFTFTPAKTTVKAGTKVTWTNNDTTVHDVTSTNGPAIDAATTSTFTSGQMNQGQTFSFTFTKPGTYYYECAIHATMATMHAVVIVK